MATPFINFEDWWSQAPQHDADAAHDFRDGPPPDLNLTSLGYLKHISHESFPYYEWMHLAWIKTCLTLDWPRLQQGTSKEAMEMWMFIFWRLELDRKAQLDMLLLAQLSEAGRTEANEILWSLLSIWALKPDYEDLSSKVSNLVKYARRNLDRPPSWHDDRAWWRWRNYWEPQNRQFGPRAVPARYTILAGPNGVPLPPPQCWGPPGPQMQ